MMGVLPRFIGYGERKLGYEFPQAPAQEGDAYKRQYNYPERTFSSEQRQFFVDTVKVTITDLVGGAIQMMNGRRP